MAVQGGQVLPGAEGRNQQRPGVGAVGDGVSWELREGAGPYDMTVEQLLQKQDKRDRTREYRVVAPFSGAWLPLPSQGCRVACNPPCTGGQMAM